MKPDLEIDAVGLKCPLPVLKAQKALADLHPDAVLRVLASDPMSRIDFPHFCAQAGHEFLGEKAQPHQDSWAFLIRKSSDET